MKKKEVKKITEKYVTVPLFEKRFDGLETRFDNSMRSVAESFARVDERFKQIDARFERIERVMGEILQELKAIREDNKYFRKSISNLNIDGSSYDRKIEDLKTRVERLEMRGK